MHLTTMNRMCCERFTAYNDEPHLPRAHHRIRKKDRGGSNAGAVLFTSGLGYLLQNPLPIICAIHPDIKNVPKIVSTDTNTPFHPMFRNSFQSFPRSTPA